MQNIHTGTAYDAVSPPYEVVWPESQYGGGSQQSDHVVESWFALPIRSNIQKGIFIYNHTRLVHRMGFH